MRIHLYAPAFLHAKHVTIDDAVTVIGSTNMDIRSFALNAEAALIVYGQDFTTRMRTVQERYFLHSHCIDLQDWRNRPFLRRVWQNLTKLADSLL